MNFKDAAIMIPGYVVLVALIAFCTSGCGAACQTERAVVDALGTGIQAADIAVGDLGGGNYERASLIAKGTQALGAAAVDACELARDSAGWQVWVEFALETTSWLVAFIDGAGPADVRVPVPIELRRAIAMLEHEASR